MKMVSELLADRAESLEPVLVPFAQFTLGGCPCCEQYDWEECGGKDAEAEWHHDDADSSSECGDDDRDDTHEFTHGCAPYFARVRGCNTEIYYDQ